MKNTPSRVGGLSYPLIIEKMKRRNKLERKIRSEEKLRKMRKEHSQNELTRYCRIMDWCKEVGFEYNEAIQYTRGLLK